MPEETRRRGERCLKASLALQQMLRSMDMPVDEAVITLTHALAVAGAQSIKGSVSPIESAEAAEEFLESVREHWREAAMQPGDVHEPQVVSLIDMPCSAAVN